MIRAIFSCFRPSSVLHYSYIRCCRLTAGPGLRYKSNRNLLALGRLLFVFKGTPFPAALRHHTTSANAKTVDKFHKISTVFSSSFMLLYSIKVISPAASPFPHNQPLDHMPSGGSVSSGPCNKCVSNPILKNRNLLALPPPLCYSIVIKRCCRLTASPV